MENSGSSQPKEDGSVTTPIEARQEISPEIRQRIEQYLETLESLGTSLLQGSAPDQVQMRKHLREEGGPAARIIIEKIKSADGKENMAIYQKAGWLSFAATPDESGEVAKLLSKDTILMEPDRSALKILMQTLGRIGSLDDRESALSFIEMRAEHNAEIYPYADSYAFLFLRKEIEEVLQAMMEIEWNNQKDDQKEGWRKRSADILARINEICRKNGMDPFTIEDLSEYFEDACASHVNFESLFKAPDQKI